MNAKVVRVAIFTMALLELSKITGLRVAVCGDIVRNTVKETGKPWNEVTAGLKRKVLKGKKYRGRR